MTHEEATVVLGKSCTMPIELGTGEEWIMCSATAQQRLQIKSTVERWLGLQRSGLAIEEWPVRCRLDKEGRIDRIERGSEIEE
jgi:hypothetical protein